MAKRKKQPQAQEIKKEIIQEEKAEEIIEEDPFLEKLTIAFLIVFLLLVIFIPGEWFNSISMWVRDHLPGLK